jgi:16S rRNA (guanine(966)-N(2))-methyltransferase RsmD
MRVTGGEFTGRHLQMPKGPEIRPTLDNVRQAIFNLIGPRIAEAQVLDLFSGTGALGIEALSRGAAHATFVDRSLFCITAIQNNLKELGLTDRTPDPVTLIRAEMLTALRKLRREEELFDIVLLDPPYGQDLARKTLNALCQYVIVGQAGWVVAEHSKRDPLPDVVEDLDVKFALQRRVQYGDTALSIFERQ